MIFINITGRGVGNGRYGISCSTTNRESRASSILSRNIHAINGFKIRATVSYAGLIFSNCKTFTNVKSIDISSLNSNRAGGDISRCAIRSNHQTARISRVGKRRSGNNGNRAI
ncbi:MAG: hypothetical protein WC441_05430 [Patescibacteria group bacterium]